MQIQQKSFTSFNIKVKNTDININPVTPTKDSIVIYSMGDSPYLKYDLNSETLLVVDAEGEYESKDVFIIGKKVKDENCILYTIAAESITVGVIAFANNPSVLPEDFFDTTDVLIIGCGGGMNFTPKHAHDIIQKLTPKVALVYGFREQANADLQGTLDSFEDIKKEISGATEIDKTFKVTSEDLERIENTEVYYFNF